MFGLGSHKRVWVFAFYDVNDIMGEILKEIEDLTSDFDSLFYYDKKKFEEINLYSMGKEDGIEENQKAIIKNMLDDNLTDEQIIKYTKISQEELNAIKKELN